MESSSGPDDPAFSGVRALVTASTLPMAVFDERETCLVASRAFILQAARYARQAQDPARNEVRTLFSPDGVRRWSLAIAGGPDGDRRAGDFIDLVANALPIMFNAKDTSSRYLFMNRFQAELYGTTPEAAVGRTAAELLGQSYGAYTRSLDADVIAAGRATPFFEESYAAIDGIERQWLTSKVPLVRQGGEVWGVATVAVDISDRKRLEARLREAKEQAESANRTKSRFLAAMSHELRTPLNGVVAFADLLRDDFVREKAKPEHLAYVEHIISSGQQLNALITDILDYANRENGTLRLALGPVDLGHLAAEAVRRVSQAASEAGIVVDCAIHPESTALVVPADTRRIAQVLDKIIGNAVKFTPRGGRVAVAVRPASDGVEMVVTDTGIGLTTTDLASIFEPFWQADSGLDREHEGAGLGLALARELVNLHGGQLAISSSGQNSGTTVRMWLSRTASVRTTVWDGQRNASTSSLRDRAVVGR